MNTWVISKTVAYKTQACLYIPRKNLYSLFLELKKITISYEL